MCARLSYGLRMYTILRSNKLSIRNATNFVPKIIDKNPTAGKNFPFEIVFRIFVHFSFIKTLATYDE